MGRGWGSDGWQPSAPTLVVVGTALALVGNLATNTVQVSWQWWPPLVWTAVGLLLVISVIIEVVRHRSERATADGELPVLRVFGAIPQPAQHFQPRQLESAELRRSLGGKGRAALVALPGQRGAGKSQIAAEYARVCVKEGYDLVAWINAASGPVADLALLAQRLGLSSVSDKAPEVIAARARDWLQDQVGGRRLLVFDNVDDPDTVTPFLPHTGSTKVIVTTNRGEFTTMAGFSVVPVGMFTPEQGQAFLHAATGLPAGADAAEVGTQLGWLPLGLAQAAAYIAGNRLSYRQYLQALAGQDLDETLRRRAGTDHPGVLKATWLSMAGLDQDDPSGDSARMLTILALLSPDGVSRALLTKVEPALGLTGGLGHSLDRLAAASLITLGGTPEDGQGRDAVVVSVHRLTARVIRHQAARPGAATLLQEATTTATRLLDLLTDDLPHTQVAHRRAELDELVAHIIALRDYVADPPPLILAQVDWAGKALYEAGDNTHALPLLESNLADRQRVLGPDHPETMASRNNLANAYWSVGQVEGAITLHEQNLADRQRVLGFDHPETLKSRNNLAASYRSVGRLNEAITLHEQNLADRQRTLGLDHSDTMISRQNLANAYNEAGRLDEAITLHEQNLADRQRVLGADHPETLKSRQNLAEAFESAGRLDEAITLHEQNLADRQRVLGADHPETLAARHNLANTYQVAGRLDEAITLHEQNVANQQRVLGPDDPGTLASRNDLANTYRLAGRVDEAITLHEQNLANQQRVLGPNHPQTMISRANLVSDYQAAGRLGQAADMSEKVLADCERTMGAHHPLTLKMRQHLASTVDPEGST